MRLGQLPTEEYTDRTRGWLMFTYETALTYCTITLTTTGFRAPGRFFFLFVHVRVRHSGRNRIRSYFRDLRCAGRLIVARVTVRQFPPGSSTRLRLDGRYAP
jgi:hypothetical protein